jgi:hypothetical protein
VNLFHTAPVLELPLAGLAGRGLGKLGLALVPMTPEVMEKLFSPLQIKHRPFVLYEVGPVQLVSTLPAGPVAPMVAPGGVRGGHLRIDGSFAGAIDTVWIGAHKFIPGEFTAIDATRAIGLTLPTTGSKAIAPGIHRVTLMSGKLASTPLELRVVPASTWSVDGPKVLAVAAGVSVTLTGQNLGQAKRVYVWPAAGIHGPEDVKSINPTATASTAVSFAAPTQPTGDCRISVEIELAAGTPLQFTPYVDLEITP